MMIKVLSCVFIYLFIADQEGRRDKLWARNGETKNHEVIIYLFFSSKNFYVLCKQDYNEC